MSQTYVVSANFSKNKNKKIPTDLQISLEKIHFDNYVIFNHKEVISPKVKISKIKLARLNPMGKIPKSIRFFLRKTENKLFNKIVNRVLFNTVSVMIPHNLRLFYYLDILEQLNDEDFVFFTDSRDLIFQEHPDKIAKRLKSKFDLHFFDERLYHFRNESTQVLGNSETNMYWLKLLKNKEMLNAKDFKNKFIINTGCIAGTVEALKHYLKIICAQIETNPYKNYKILDQAAANLFIYEKKAKVITATSHRNGEFVLNMCGVINEEVKNEEGILKINNILIPIIHQYDRFAKYHEDLGIKFIRSKSQYQDLV
jgi:hypothetical protein